MIHSTASAYRVICILSTICLLGLFQVQTATATGEFDVRITPGSNLNYIDDVVHFYVNLTIINNATLQKGQINITLKDKGVIIKTISNDIANLEHGRVEHIVYDWSTKNVPPGKHTISATITEYNCTGYHEITLMKKDSSPSFFIYIAIIIPTVAAAAILVYVRSRKVNRVKPSSSGQFDGTIFDYHYSSQGYSLSPTGFEEELSLDMAAFLPAAGEWKNELGASGLRVVASPSAKSVYYVSRFEVLTTADAHGRLGMFRVRFARIDTSDPGVLHSYPAAAWRTVLDPFTPGLQAGQKIDNSILNAVSNSAQKTELRPDIVDNALTGIARKNRVALILSNDATPDQLIQLEQTSFEVAREYLARKEKVLSWATYAISNEPLMKLVITKKKNIGAFEDWEKIYI